MTAPSAPVSPKRPVIEAYGGGGFRVSGVAHVGSILILTERTVPWPVVSAEQITIENLSPIVEAEAQVELLLLGCGPKISTTLVELGATLKIKSIAVEVMDTGAACRTFNLLMAEDRLIAAALIAV